MDKAKEVLRQIQEYNSDMAAARVALDEAMEQRDEATLEGIRTPMYTVRIVPS